MQQRAIHHEGRTFIRIPANRARRAYNNGLAVIVSPCNMHPFSPWGVSSTLRAGEGPRRYEEFSRLVDTFAGYNCNRETGLYPAFYIPVRETQHVDHPRTEYDYSFLEA